MMVDGCKAGRAACRAPEAATESDGILCCDAGQPWRGRTGGSGDDTLK